jgi:hypothetical protein
MRDAHVAVKPTKNAKQQVQSTQHPIPASTHGSFPTPAPCGCFDWDHWSSLMTGFVVGCSVAGPGCHSSLERAHSSAAGSHAAAADVP